MADKQVLSENKLQVFNLELPSRILRRAFTLGPASYLLGFCSTLFKGAIQARLWRSYAFGGFLMPPFF